MFGNPIALISKSLIRYVGTLNDVNEANKTISLEQVRSMGTEGRRGNPAEEIPPSNDVYEFIQFSATDVLSVDFVNDDPAIIAQAYSPPPTYATAPAPVERQQQLAPSYVAPGVVPAGVPATQPAPAGADYQQSGQQRQDGYPQRGGRGGYGNRGGSSSRGGYSSTRGTGPRRGGYQGRGGYQARPGRPIEVPESDFDFESSNSKLNKDDLAKEFAKMDIYSSAAAGLAGSSAAAASTSAAPRQPAAAAESTAYKPASSFFDDISCESKERMQMRENVMNPEERRSRMNAEHRQNYETFGQAVAEQNRFRYNRFHGGRGGAHPGSGGRGGRGRGGYNGAGGRSYQQQARPQNGAAEV
ncbi:hypothetical protein IWQ56_000482 [Coemansia nantahalensis]|nr:hypothetical protein IWQ56_000482 [Coemansia nantahalensis]